MQDATERCDVAVIGAGLGGLTAAALLAQAGLDVAVFEAQAQPGGYACGFARRGFTFDASIQWLNQCRPGGLVYRLLGSLGDDFPRCRPLERIFRFKGDTFDYTLTASPAALENRLIADFPAEERGIRRFFADGERVGAITEFLGGYLRAADTMSPAERLRHGLRMTRWTAPLWRHLATPVERGLARYFRDPALRRVFGHQESLMSVLVPVGWAANGDFQAPPPGGTPALVRWLCRQAEARGARIHLGRRVTAVRLDAQGAAAGVALDGGAEVRARYVIAGGDVQTLFDELLPPGSIPERRRAAQRRADLYYSSFAVFLGLDCSPAVWGLGEELLHLTRDDVPRAAHRGGDPRCTALAVLAPSLRDPSLAPPGHGTLTIHCPAYFEQFDGWRTGEGRARGQAYRALKDQFADILIDRVERAVAPGLRQHIVVREAATPVTYWRYTGNQRGSVMGTRPTGRNIRARLAGCATPVRNLFLAGHWAEYGGGVPLAMKAAANASLLVLRAERAPAFDALRRTLDGRGRTALVVGIPRALGYFIHPGLWETFFRALGLRVRVSSATTRRTVERAALIAETENCLPVKILDAHLAELADAADWLFVPRILSTLAGHIACPKLGALPDVAQAQFGRQARVLTVDIDERRTPLSESLLALGLKLGAEEPAVRAASRTALAALAAARHAAAPAQTAAAQPTGATPAAPAPRHLLLLGHPYNLADDFMSGPVRRKLAALGVNVATVAHGAGPVAAGPLKWDACSTMYDALRRADPASCAGVIQLTSFNCGCDSIAGAIYRTLLQEKGIPCMTLILDEHAGQAGVDTRLEAFVDSIGWDAEPQAARGSRAADR